MSKRRHPVYDWEWDQFVIALIRERGRICESTLHVGERTLTILQVVYGDHVVELIDGGAKLDPGNVLLNCAKCHGKKTYQERQRRNGIHQGSKPEIHSSSDGNHGPSMDERGSNTLGGKS